MRPRFSVVITVRDRADVVGRAVAAVLAQTFANHEVVVVDRDSIDDTLNAVRSVADHRVRVVGGPDDGAAAACDRGIEAARGRWITLLDVDDEVAPGWLARIGRVIDSTDAELVTCGGEQRHADGSISRILPTPVAGHDVRACWRSGAYVATRRLLVEVGGFTGSVAPGDPARLDRQAHEVGELMVLAALGSGRGVVHTPEPLVRWNEVVADGDAPSREHLRLRWSLQGLDALARTPIPDGALLTRYAVAGGVAAARLRDREEARRLFRLARRLEPRVPRHWARWLAALVPPVADRVWSAEDTAVPTSEIAVAPAR